MVNLFSSFVIYLYFYLSVVFRLLAFELEFVREEDIIVTADVDAFIMTKDILLPLKLVKFT